MLRLILGPMKAHKTQTLLGLINHHHDVGGKRGEKACYINVLKDDRSKTTVYSTHSSDNKRDFLFSQFKVVRLSEVDVTTYKYIGIDEDQFFPDLVDTVRLWLSQKKIIIVAGLNGSFQQKPIGDIVQLIPEADRIDLQLTECDYCPAVNGVYLENAAFTIRISDETEVEVIGGDDKYQTVCRYHRDPLCRVGLKPIKK